MSILSFWSSVVAEVRERQSAFESMEKEIDRLRRENENARQWLAAVIHAAGGELVIPWQVIDELEDYTDAAIERTTKRNTHSELLRVVLGEKPEAPLDLGVESPRFGMMAETVKAMRTASRLGDELRRTKAWLKVMVNKAGGTASIDAEALDDVDPLILFTQMDHEKRQYFLATRRDAERRTR